MPLRDHFNAPLNLQGWESVYAFWTTCLAETLNQILPRNYLADLCTEPTIEIDTSTPVLPAAYTPPAPTSTLHSTFANDFEIKIYRGSGGFELAAAIELVSPGNKDRPDARIAFAAKCASYLHNSVAVIIVDIVTERLANLHDEIWPLITTAEAIEMGEGKLYAVAYRPILRNKQANIDVWQQELEIGKALPTLPLWLNAVLAMPLDFETTYATALRRARIE